MRLFIKLSVLVVILAFIAFWFVRRDGDTEVARVHDAAGGPKVVIIGADGLDWERVDRLASAGRLPNLERLRQDGASGILHSIPPYVSPTIWTTIATGKLEEKHGICGFTVGGVKGSPDAELVDSGMIKCRTLWEILHSAGRTSGVVGWLVTYPPVPVTTYTVTPEAIMAMSFPPSDRSPGPGAVDPRTGVYPQDLWDDISGVGIRPADIPKEDVLAHLGTLDYLDRDVVQNQMDAISRRLAGDRTTIAIARKLMLEYPTDLTAIYIRSSDIISHFFWKYWEPDSWTSGPIAPEIVETFRTVIDRYYESVDAMVGQILEDVDDNTIVIVCSDHGFAGHKGHPGFVPSSEGEMAFGENMHREKGALIVVGPGILHGTTVEGASPLDITPTVLTALGLPTARDMDGRPLTAVFQQSFLDRHPVSYVDTYEIGERVRSDGPSESPVDDEIKEMLRSLGYIN